MNEYTNNGVMYIEEIVSAEGSLVIVFPNADHTEDQIKTAIAEIRHRLGPLSLRVATEDDRDEHYRTSIFNEPLTKPLVWYQINDDMKLIREQRLKGTTPLEYLQQFVLPCTEETKERFYQKFGEKMYGR